MEWILIFNKIQIKGIVSTESKTNKVFSQNLIGCESLVDFDGVHFNQFMATKTRCCLCWWRAAGDGWLPSTLDKHTLGAFLEASEATSWASGLPLLPSPKASEKISWASKFGADFRGWRISGLDRKRWFLLCRRKFVCLIFFSFSLIFFSPRRNSSHENPPI